MKGRVRQDLAFLAGASLLPNTLLFPSQPPGANQVAWHFMTRELATATGRPFAAALVTGTAQLQVRRN